MESDPSQLRLKYLLAMGEGIRLEYKEAKTSLPTNVFETICAMLNRDGGDTLLGVDIDGPVFTTVIPLPMEEVAGQVETTSGIESEKRRYNVGITSEKILQTIEQNASITISELASLIGVTERFIERNIQKLQSLGLLERIGGRKEGHWKVSQ